MSSKHSPLYGLSRPRNINNGKEISAPTTLSFTSQLSSLINSSSSGVNRPSSKRSKSNKEDIFATHNSNIAKRAKRDLDADHAGIFEQKHSTSGEALDRGLWERSKRKMEEKARLYAAMKRGEVEDVEEQFAVDFDTKWADARADSEEKSSSSDNGDDDEASKEQVEYIDEFGRTRMGSRLAALRAKQEIERQRGRDDRFTARPAAPANLIYGDTIQHEAFDPDAPIVAQMEELARKRDRSLTPPPDEHFDSRKEVRTKGTGFFQFSQNADERKEQMENLNRERLETQQRRTEKDEKLSQRKALIEARRDEIRRRNAKRKADDFLRDLEMKISATANERATTEEVGGSVRTASDMTERIEAAIEREEDGL